MPHLSSKVVLVLAAVATAVMASRAQAPAQKPSFEVASVKPVAPPYPSSAGPWTVDHGRFIAQMGWVRGVIGYAYNVLPAVKVHGGPAWIDTDRYSFQAKAEDPNAGPDQIKAMIQTLLVDRFKLVVHREIQQEQVYTLVVGKSGSKMLEAKEETEGRIAVPGLGQIVCTECPLMALTNTFSNILGSPVLDNTGLKGVYNFSLEYADPRWNSKDLPSELSSRPDIFTALQEQLGLRLESAKGPVEVLVIDHVERPSEN